MRAFRSAEEALCWAAECTLATCESMPKRTAKSERRRQESIAATLVEACRVFVTAKDCDSNHCIRVAKRLRGDKGE